MRLALGAALALAWASEASGQPLTAGPYSFSDERLFAQTATFTAYPGWDPQSELRFYPIGTMTLQEAVTGFSPETSLINVGNPCGPVPCGGGGGSCPPPEESEIVELGFHADFLPFDAAGADLLIFDARQSVDNYAVSIRPVGGTFTPHHLYLSTDQVPTGLPGPDLLGTSPTVEIWAIEVDFEDFGVAPGTQVDSIRIIGDCMIDPWVEFDLVMAAAVDRTCQVDGDCDDGEPCTDDACSMGTCTFSPLRPFTPCAGGFCDGNARPRCVSCLDDSHCQAPTPACELGRNECVACLQDDHCQAPEPFCDLQANECVE